MNDDLDKYIGKVAMKKSSGMYGGLAGIVRKSEYGITPLILDLGAVKLGAFPKDLIFINKDGEEVSYEKITS